MYFILAYFFLNFLFILNFKRISSLINLFDTPDGKRKLHSQPVASIGGFLILINLLLFFILRSYQFFFLEYNFDYGNYFNFCVFYFFLLVFFLLGYLDDKFILNPNLKLSLFVLLGSGFLSSSKFLVLNTLQFSFLEISINVIYLDFLFTLLSILLFINAFNMFDGINLQSAIYSLHIFLLFMLKGIFLDISIVIIISLIFFSYLNLKNKCFLGNNGSLAVAFIISYLFLRSQSTNNPFYADEVFLAMQIPGLDLLRLTIERILTKKHPFHPDRNHIHHLMVACLGWRKALLFLFVLIVIPNVLSVLYGNTIYYVILTLVIYLFVIFKLKKEIKNSKHK
jgi:UDP-GlcNAc:undecaprenyl-phosphate GlcNAc-1-phosphate transferase